MADTDHTDILALSSRIIDEGLLDEPTNRITQQLSEVGDGVALVESFSHSILVESGDELVAVDTSAAFAGARVVAAVRAWRKARISHVVYTHGHIDHVGGSGHFAADAADRGHRPAVHVAHEAVERRFDRYRLTNGWNLSINNRQFGGLRGGGILGPDGTESDFLASDVVSPDLTYDQRLDLTVADEPMHLRHHLGETDDHSWVWFPERRLLCPGDLFIWHFPNAGNPQKVQRYAREWAQALRAMAALGAELFVPSHGLPIAGADRIRTCLETVAGVLERLERDTLAMMNADATLDEIIHTVKPTPEELAIPYLTPLYDEPEFVVRNIWRRYGGWWDGTPSSLKPAPVESLAGELADLAGGWRVLADRAEALSSSGDHRLACHLADYAANAAGQGEAALAHGMRAEVYRRRVGAEDSLMSKGIYSGAVRESEAVAQSSSPES